MSTNDDRRSRVTKHHIAPRPSSKSVGIGSGSGPAPMHSSSPSASRRRPRRPAGATNLRPSDSQQKTARSPLLPLLSGTLGLCSKVTAKCALLTCACGLAWASLIVWILGPAVSSASSATTASSSRRNPTAAAGNRRYLDRPGPFPIAGHSGEGGFLLPGWTPQGHHARFVGGEAFPEQFAHWGEEQKGEAVVVNGVDLGPLTTVEEALPASDLVLAILSGDDEVRGCFACSCRRESCWLRDPWVARRKDIQFVRI